MDHSVGRGLSGQGTLFKMTPKGQLTILYSFCSLPSCLDGQEAEAALIQANDGNFYGTTSLGGNSPPEPFAAGAGTIFKITPEGQLTTIYNICSTGNDCEGGLEPYAPLVQDTGGVFYGTTKLGGGGNTGTVFSLSMGLPPFVKLQTTSGKAGEVIQILGTSLTGSTNVYFDGVASTFKVVSPSLIAAIVPSGARTGSVEVVTPSATLLSNVPFQIRP